MYVYDRKHNSSHYYPFIYTCWVRKVYRECNNYMTCAVETYQNQLTKSAKLQISINSKTRSTTSSSIMKHISAAA